MLLCTRVRGCVHPLITVHVYYLGGENMGKDVSRCVITGVLHIVYPPVKQ